MHKYVTIDSNYLQVQLKKEYKGNLQYNENSNYVYVSLQDSCWDVTKLRVSIAAKLPNMNVVELPNVNGLRSSVIMSGEKNLVKVDKIEENLQMIFTTIGVGVRVI